MGVLPMNQSSVEKKECSAQIATMSRPVNARASLTAAVVTSEPFLANFTISPPLTRLSTSSEQRNSMGEGLVKFVAERISSYAASHTDRFPCPRFPDRRPHP